MDADDIRRPSLAEILRDYRAHKLNEEWRGEWMVVLSSRPLSVPIVWLLARTAVSPTMVTLSALPLLIAMPLIAGALPLTLAPLALAAAGFAFQVLDCVDGGLARATGRTSRVGATIDFLIDMAQWGVLYASFGLLADRLLDTGTVWTCVGLAAGWLRLFARVVRDAGDGLSSVPAPEDRDEPAPPASEMATLDMFYALIAGLSGGLWLLFLVAWQVDVLPGFMMFLILYSSVDVVDALISLRDRAR